MTTASDLAARVVVAFVGGPLTTCMGHGLPISERGR